MKELISGTLPVGKKFMMNVLSKWLLGI
jgi:hypothetical protein